MSIRGFVRSIRILYLATVLAIGFWRISRLERRVKGGKTQAKDKLDRLYSQMGVHVRRAALRLQGLMVKVGQFLSTRTDILPTSFTRELKSLQDAVPGVAFAEVKKIVESETGSHLATLFDTFDEQPIAAASLGQVHRATLAQGGVVAVKVLRPGIEKLADIDLSTLKLVTRILQRYTKIGRRVQAVAIYREFAGTVREELDYRIEVQHLLRFRKQFAERKDIIVPRAFEAFSSRRVLVMEFIQGIKISDTATLEAKGIDIGHLVDLVVDSYIEQVLVHGFIHVDPHPGNLLVMDDGRLCFLDFGMMSEIPESEAVTFAKLLLAGMNRDLETVVQSIDALGFLQPHADRTFLKRAVGYIIDRINGIELRRGAELDAFVEEFQAFLRDEPLVLQAKYMFLGRALGMVLGLVNSLNPNMEWLPLLRERGLPKLSRIVERATGGGADGGGWQQTVASAIGNLFGETAASASRVLLSQFQSTALATIRLPQKVERVLDKIDRNELEIKLELTELYERLERQQRRLSRLSWGVALLLLTTLGVWLRTHLHPSWAVEVWIVDVVVLLRFLVVARPRPNVRRARRR